jgi:hypothetical protein
MGEALLRLCLASAHPGDDEGLDLAAERLTRAVTRSGLEGLTVHNPAILVAGLAAAKVVLPPATRRRLKALALREERRSVIAAEQCDQLEAAFRDRGVKPTSIRGWRFAETWHPAPLARHCHALRWRAANAGELEAMSAIVTAAAWRAEAPMALCPHKRVFVGAGRVAVELHSRDLPWCGQTHGAAVRQSVEFQAAELIGATLVEGSRQSLRWAIDLAFMLRGARLDPARFAEVVAAFGMAAYVDQALELVARCAPRGDEPVQSQIAALRLALARRGAPRDARAVRDLRRLVAISARPRAAFVAALLRRPDLARRSLALRRETRERRRGSAARRAELLGRLREARDGETQA